MRKDHLMVYHLTEVQGVPRAYWAGEDGIDLQNPDKDTGYIADQFGTGYSRGVEGATSGAPVAGVLHLEDKTTGQKVDIYDITDADPNPNNEGLTVINDQTGTTRGRLNPGEGANVPMGPHIIRVSRPRRRLKP